eukprot:100385-Chlamydomonas_euryale.AAC.8
MDDSRRLRMQEGHAACRLDGYHASLTQRRPSLGGTQLAAEAAPTHIIRHDARNGHLLVLRADMQAAASTAATLVSATRNGAAACCWLHDDAIHSDDVGVVELSKHLSLAHEALTVLRKAVALKPLDGHQAMRLDTCI